MKPQLPMTVTHHYRVHYQDLEAFLAKVYSTRDYDFLLATGCVNGMCQEYRVTGKIPPARNAGQMMERIRKGRRSRDVGLILNTLCLDEFIPRGIYVIDTTKREDPVETYVNLLHETNDPEHPICVDYRRKHAGNEKFQRRARVLGKLTLEYKESLLK